MCVQVHRGILDTSICIVYSRCVRVQIPPIFFVGSLLFLWVKSNLIHVTNKNKHSKLETTWENNLVVVEDVLLADVVGHVLVSWHEPQFQLCVVGGRRRTLDLPY